MFPFHKCHKVKRSVVVQVGKDQVTHVPAKERNGRAFSVVIRDATSLD